RACRRRPLFAYTTLFRSPDAAPFTCTVTPISGWPSLASATVPRIWRSWAWAVISHNKAQKVDRRCFITENLCLVIACASPGYFRSEEHTSELQSRENLVC